MPIRIENREAVNYNAPDASTGQPKKDKYLDFIDDENTTVATLTVPANGDDPTFTVDSVTLEATTQTVYSASVTLTNAQIKTLFAGTPVVVKASTETLGYAGAPTEMFIPISAYAIVNTTAGAYTNVDAANYALIAYGSDWSTDASGKTYLDPTDTLENAQVSIIPFGIPWSHAFVTTTPEASGIRPVSIALSSSLQDNALVIAGGNGSAGALTGGHADNTMKVVISYIVVEV